MGDIVVLPIEAVSEVNDAAEAVLLLFLVVVALMLITLEFQ